MADLRTDFRGFVDKVKLKFIGLFADLQFVFVVWDCIVIFAVECMWLEHVLLLYSSCGLLRVLIKL